jgi:hypothetical protein
MQGSDVPPSPFRSDHMSKLGDTISPALLSGVSTTPILPFLASDPINTSAKPLDASSSTPSSLNVRKVNTPQPYHPLPITDLEPQTDPLESVSPKELPPQSDPLVISKVVGKSPEMSKAAPHSDHQARFRSLEQDEPPIDLRDKDIEDTEYPIEETEEDLLSDPGNYGDTAPGTTALVMSLRILAATTTSTSAVHKSSPEIQDLPTGTESDDILLNQYVQNMPLDRKVIDLVSETELNTDLLDVNAIPAEQKHLWRNEEEDADCRIIEDVRLDAPVSTPAPEESHIDNPPKGQFKMDDLMISSQTRRQL